MKLFSLILVVFLAKKSNSLCEDQINTDHQFIAVKREDEANCTWKITAPLFDRVWIRVSVLHFEVENSSVCPNYLMLEETKDNEKNLLKRYCTPVNRDYIKSNFNQILVTAYNIKFKISWHGLDKKETGFNTDELHSTTEKPVFQTTNNVKRVSYYDIHLLFNNKTNEENDLSYPLKRLNTDKFSFTSHKDKIFIVIGSSSALILVCVIGIVIRKRCFNRVRFPVYHDTYVMKTCLTNTTDETSKRTQENSEVSDQGISGIDRNIATEGNIDTKECSGMEEKTKPSLSRSRGLPSSYDQHVYVNAKLTDVEQDDYWCLENPYENQMQEEVFSDTNKKTNKELRHSSDLYSDDADYVNLN